MTELLFLPGIAVLFSLANWRFAYKKPIFLHLLPLVVLLILPVYGLLFSDAPLEAWRASWITAGQNPGFYVAFEFSTARLMPALLCVGLSLLILWYSRVYLHSHDHFGYYAFLITMFALSMSWLFCAANLFTLLLSWEWVGLISYLLVQFWYKTEKRAQSAWRVLLINKLGDISLIIGFSLWLTGSYVDFPALAHAGAMQNLSLSWPAAVFLVLAALIKSAQFPFSIWLKEAMAGPTAVSALLHSATMVVAGVWLLVQLSPILPVDLFPTLTTIGLITFLMGNIWAAFSAHFKNLLAFSTVAQLGLMITFIGLHHTGSALLHVHTHAFFKAGLFLACGYLMHQAETVGILKDMEAQFIPNLGPYLANSRLFFFAFAFLLLALAGWPFTSGFISKESGMPAWSEAVKLKYGLLYFGALQIGLAISGFYTARLLVYVSLHFQPRQGWLGIAPGFLVPVLLLALGSGFWLLGPHPFSADGWLSALLQIQVPGLHFDVFALIIGSIAGGVFAYKNGSYTDSGFVQQCISGLLNLNMALFRFGWSSLLSFASVCRRADHNLLDLPILRLAQAGIVAGHFSAFFDRYVVDGLLLFSVKTGRFTGQIFWSHSRQSPQGFALFLLLFLTCCLLLLLVF